MTDFQFLYAVPWKSVLEGAALIFLFIGAWTWLQLKSDPERGTIDSPDASAFVRGKCGDAMKISLNFFRDRVVEAKYWTDGCRMSSACGAAAAKLALHKTPEEIADIDHVAIEKEVGALPEEDLHTVQPWLREHFRRQSGSTLWAMRIMERQMPQAGPCGEDRLTNTKEMIPTSVCEQMIISVASGKGGTGKTTIATSLAAVLGSRAQLLDCDVEEPNCHILMKPVLQTCESITVPVPIVDMDKCTLCGKCSEVCRFSAIVVIGDQVLTFPEMCHGCGGCSLLCPERAIGEGSRELGVLETGFTGPVEFVQGRLRIGEAMSPPLIRAVKEKINPNKMAILDAPPGASCPVINTVMGSDFVILVTEPTPFGLHDLRIAVEALAPLEIPCGQQRQYRADCPRMAKPSAARHHRRRRQQGTWRRPARAGHIRRRQRQRR